MSFALSNGGDTFHRERDHAFDEVIKKIILVYLDDIIVFFKSIKD